MPSSSIIIPVYNTARYLRDCLESILAQDVQDMEIICVNDGSTDHSLQILKEYAVRDSRIKIINQQNQGVSAARNAGLNIARGKYIGFVDADDTVEPDYFLRLLAVAMDCGADAVFSSMSLSDQNGVKIYEGDVARTELLPEFFRSDHMNSICTKLFSRSIIDAENIRLPVGLSQGEDRIFNILFLLKANKVAVTEYGGYHYREVAGSATRNLGRHDYLQHIVDVYQSDWSEMVESYIPPEKMQTLKDERLIKSIMALVYMTAIPENNLSFTERIKRLKAIVKQPEVRRAFSAVGTTHAKGSYGRLMHTVIRKGYYLLLFILSLYSYHRGR